jgi:hypothetical protein
VVSRVHKRVRNRYLQLVSGEHQVAGNQPDAFGYQIPE